MKAIVVRQTGGPDVLKLDDIQEPVVPRGFVAIKLHHAAVNHVDILVREGRMEDLSLPIVPGVEGAGQIVDLGRGVTDFEMGDRVFFAPMISCRACWACVAGQESACLNLQLVGEHRSGTYAEYVAVPADNVFRAPSALSSAQVASSMVAFMTAWHMLKTRAKCRDGQSVLVMGAGSGVGSAAVQVARALGCRVIATTGSSSKAERLRAIGAEDVIVYRESPDVHVAVHELTNGRGVDIVHESVGRATIRESILSARNGGRVVGMGSHTGSAADIDLWAVYRREIELIGAHTATLADIREMLPLLDNESLRPIVDSMYPLAEAASAHGRLSELDRFGKVVLEIP